MNSMDAFRRIVSGCPGDSSTISNLWALHLPDRTPCLKIVWMYPDILSLHGGRGDIMALLRFATAAGIPVSISKVTQPTDPLPQKADLLYFCSGDLLCTDDLVKALSAQRAQLDRLIRRGCTIAANGSSGAILAEELTMLDGTVIRGLGLLGMHWKQRQSVKGDDLWLRLTDGTELIGTQIALADITLNEDQVPLGTVLYGYGNNGNHAEGAVRGRILYTACLGPVLVRNPQAALVLLQRAAVSAGILKPDTTLDPGDLSREEAIRQDAIRFIHQKTAQAKQNG